MKLNLSSKMIAPKIIFLGIIMMTAFGANAQTGPVLSLNESSFDHGTIMENDSVSHTFQITNSGDATLNVSAVEVTCVCLTTSLSSNAIGPGQSATLSVLFKTEGKMGRQHKIITLVSNANPPKTHISLMGEILPAD